jgi:hypothetical protein
VRPLLQHMLNVISRVNRPGVSEAPSREKKVERRDVEARTIRQSCGSGRSGRLPKCGRSTSWTGRPSWHMRPSGRGVTGEELRKLRVAEIARDFGGDSEFCVLGHFLTGTRSATGAAVGHGHYGLGQGVCDRVSGVAAGQLYRHDEPLMGRPGWRSRA